MLLFLPHYNLQKLNTLAVPAVADYFESVSTEKELIEALAFAREKNLPRLILGGGSNIVLRDDFHGLVIRIQLLGKELVREDENYFYVKAMAGEDWAEFVDYCLDNHFWGLENLSLIPGTVGAAPIQNIGAYGVEVKDLFYELTALDIRSNLTVHFDAAACQFAYRDSVFKQSLLDQMVITSVTFKLQKIPCVNLSYPALKNYFLNTDNINSEINCPTPLQVGEAVCEIRRSKLPDPAQVPNVGSFFKNPIVTSEEFNRLLKIAPQVAHFSASEGFHKLAAAWLIDQAGWKGYCGQASVHPQQALVLTNPNKVSGKAVLELAAQIQTSVQEKFGVILEMEPRVYPTNE